MEGLAGNGRPVLFEPDASWIHKSGLQMEDILLIPNEAGLVDLVIHNPTSEARRVSADAEIGVVQIKTQ